MAKTGPWPSPISRVPVSPKFPADGGHFLDVTGGPGNRGWTLGYTPTGRFPCQMLLWGFFFFCCHPSALTRSPSSMSFEQLWGLGRLLSELTQLCVTAACDRYTRECLCFAKCTTRFSVFGEGHHLLCFRGAGAHTRVFARSRYFGQFVHWISASSRHVCAMRRVRRQ